ncbi:MAG: hypothetical protein AB1422_06405 [bacterium]
MKTYKYLLEFSNKDKGFSLGIINERKEVNDTKILDLYFLLLNTAKELAQKHSLELTTTSSTSKEAQEVKDIVEYAYKDGSFNEERFRRHLEWLFTKNRIPTFLIRLRTLLPFDELVGRENLILEILELLKERHISLRAPRCYGKTSILNAIFERPPQPYQPLFIQARNLQDVRAFLGAIGYEIKKGNSLERQKQREEIEKTSKEGLESILPSLFPQDKHYLLLVDEFAEFLRNLKNNNEPLNFDRFFNLSNIRFITASSEAEDRIAGQTLSNFEKIDLPLLERQDANLLLEELAYNSQIIPKKGEIEEICNLLETYVPYFIHIFVYVWNEVYREKKDVCPEEIYERLIGKEGWNLLRDFQDLPRRYPGRLSSAGYAMLSEMAKEEIEKGMAKKIFKEKTGLEQEEFENMIQWLIDDLLIEEKNGKYSFKSKLLRDFWRRFPAK